MKLDDRHGPTPFRVTVEQVGDHCVVHVTGELDISTTSRVSQALTRRLVDGKEAFVVVDLRDVTFLDSSGLGMLVAMHKRLRASHGSFALVCSEGRALSLISMTGLLHVFDVYDTLEAATADRPPDQQLLAATVDDPS